jgi:hypothetical protein
MSRYNASIATASAILSVLCLAEFPRAAQTAVARPQLPPETAEGKPNFNGIWQVLNTANWNIQDHTGELGVPAGQGVVEGNEIPYQPWARAKKQENYAKRATADLTESECYLPGVPRATYMPYPFEIVQTPNSLAIRYEFAHAFRTIPMNGSSHPEGFPATWMGDSRGRWEGDTLVVDANNFNDQTWFDRAGNFHSDALQVVERYTLTSADHILYEATITDPKVFTRPWKIIMPLYRRTEKNVKLLEYECVFYLQEQRYKK